MPHETDLRRSRALAKRMMVCGSLLLALSLVMLLVALAYPIEFDTQGRNTTRRRQVTLLTAPKRQTGLLLKKMAGRRLMRPSQIQAAIKDDGRAERLLKALKLQGVVQMGDDYVAYVQIDKRGVRAIRRGEAILGFSVQNVEPGKVTLSLEGVQAVLSH